MSKINSLTACLVKMAQLVQQPLDRHALLQAVDEVHRLKRLSHPGQVVAKVVKKLALPAVKSVRSPDPADMPLLGYHRRVGWLLV